MHRSRRRCAPRHRRSRCRARRWTPTTRTPPPAARTLTVDVAWNLHDVVDACSSYREVVAARVDLQRVADDTLRVLGAWRPRTTSPSIWMSSAIGADDVDGAGGVVDVDRRIGRGSAVVNDGSEALPVEREQAHRLERAPSTSDATDERPRRPRSTRRPSATASERRSSRTQPAQHREHAAVVGSAGREVELGEDVADVLLDRAVADHERAARSPRSTGPRPSARAPRARAATAARADPGAGCGRAAARRPRGRARCRRRRPGARVDELAHVGDAVLQQVADARACRRRAARWRSAPRRTARARGCRSRASGSRISSAARRPSSVNVGGMRTSTTARSGWCRSTASTSSVGVADRGDDLLARVVEQAGEPARSSTESSAITTRMGAPRRIVVGPPAGLTHLHPAAEAAHAFLEAGEAGAVGDVGAADAVVAHLDRRAVAAARDRDRRLGRAACLATLVSASATTKYAALSTGAGGRGATSTSSVDRAPARGRRPPTARRRARGPRGSRGGSRARGRAARRARPSPPRARRRRAAAGAVRVVVEVLARPDRGPSPSATSRCWAPSCRSRSMRRRSASALSTAATRLALERARPRLRAQRDARRDRAASAQVTASSAAERDGDPRREEQRRRRRRRARRRTRRRPAPTSNRPNFGGVAGQRVHVERQREQRERAAPRRRPRRRTCSDPERQQEQQVADLLPAARRLRPRPQAPPPVRRRQRRVRDRRASTPEQRREPGALDVAEPGGARRRAASDTGSRATKVMSRPTVVASSVITTLNVTTPTTTSVTRWVRVHHVDECRHGSKTRPSTPSR